MAMPRRPSSSRIRVGCASSSEAGTRSGAELSWVIEYTEHTARLYCGLHMPELPEVETVANGVHERVHGQTIRSVWTSNKPQTFKSSPALIAETLTGARIARVYRVGKTIVVDLRRKTETIQFLVHLGMTGRLLVSAP